jgi:5-methylcytosine-specific restriction endonuclease McrA
MTYTSSIVRPGMFPQDQVFCPHCGVCMQLGDYYFITLHSVDFDEEGELISENHIITCPECVDKVIQLPQDLQDTGDFYEG